MIYNASNIDLRHFDVVIANYDPKRIHAEAIQATEENIGKLSLEFEEELYNDGKGLWFGFDAERTKEDGSADMPQELYVLVGSWIVALRGELHVFPGNVFQNTFRVELRDESIPIEKRESFAGEPTQTMAPVGGVNVEKAQHMTGIITAVGELTTDEVNGKFDRDKTNDQAD